MTLRAEPDALIGADRNGVEQQHAGEHHHAKPTRTHGSMRSFISDTGTRVKRQAEQPQIEHHRQADEQQQEQDVRRLDERVHEERLAERGAVFGGGEPLAEREQRHGYLTDVIAGSNCLWQFVQTS